MEVNKLFKIGDFSKLTMISIRMLRHYDNINLLTPEYIDYSSGYRYYSVQQLSQASRIQSLKSMGFSLNTIKNLLEIYENPENLKQYLKIHFLQLMEESDKLKNQILLVNSMINNIGKDDKTMNYNVTIKKFPEMQAASIRSIIPTYYDEGNLWTQLHKELEGQKIQYTNPSYCMSVYFDEGYKENNVDVELRLSVTGKYTDTENVKFKNFNSITAATVIMKGDFTNIYGCCEAIGKWISDNKYSIDGSMFIIYHTNPGKEKNTEKWITEICFPVIKK